MDMGRPSILDFTKAFYKVAHKIYIHKLNYNDISGSIATWFENVLMGKTQQVVVNGASSSIIVTYCVPRSPGNRSWAAIFLIYINDLPDNLSTSVGLRKLQKWQDTWLMEFNLDKCYTMPLATRTPTPNMPVFCGQTLAFVDSHCYLGIHLSHTFDWAAQTKLANTSY